MGQTQHTVGTANVRASCMGCYSPAMSVRPAPAPTSSAAMTTCRARPTSGSISLRCRSTTAWPKAPGSTGRGFGKSTTTSSSPLRRQEDHGDARHPADPLVRCGSCRKIRLLRKIISGNVRAGSRQQQYHAHSGIDEGAQGARATGRRRSASDDLGLARGGGRTQGGHLSPAGLPLSSNAKARALLPTARCSGASRSSSRSSSRRTTSRSCT